jgi:hypothetical protein
VRRFVAALASILVLVATNLLAQAVFPSIRYESGNHEVATTIALGLALLTGAIVYMLYPRVRRSGRKS